MSKNNQKLLDFLSDLKQNNNKLWMDANRARYEDCRDAFKELAKYFQDKLCSIDVRFGEVKLNQYTYRINRNNRFQRDLPPYKDFFAASYKIGGKKMPTAEFYFQVSPNGNSGIGCGVWGPEKEALQKIRQEIDYNPEPLLAFLSTPYIKKNYGGFYPKARLKRPPKSYSADHPNIELLKCRHYAIYRDLSDVNVCSKTYKTLVWNNFKKIEPLFHYLNLALES